MCWKNKHLVLQPPMKWQTMYCPNGDAFFNWLKKSFSKKSSLFVNQWCLIFFFFNLGSNWECFKLSLNKWLKQISAEPLVQNYISMRRTETNSICHILTCAYKRDVEDTGVIQKSSLPEANCRTHIANY